MVIRKLSLFILITVMSVFVGSVQAQEATTTMVEPTAQSASNLNSLETFVDATIDTQMKALDIPAVTVSIVKGGKIVYAKGYGTADMKKQTPVIAGKTLFRPGSTSKLFTWTAVMQMVEEGKLDLNADVNIYLKTFQIPATYDEPITLTHILAHTSGFEEGGLGYLIINDPEKITSLKESLSKHIPKRINKPGAYSSYSNYATALAGLIVENVSGIPFNDYIKQRIFDPLGMSHSSFAEPLPANLIENMATGYKRKLGVYKKQPFEIIANFAPAGSLSSTSVDMAKFMMAHLNDGRLGEGQILRPETARLMHSRLFEPDARLSGMAHGFYEQFINGHRLIGHGGDTTLFHTNFMLDKAEDLGIFVSYMGAKGGKARGEFVQAFYDKYYPEELKHITPPADFADRAKQYVGTYNFWRHNVSSVEKALGIVGGLTVTATADNTLLFTGLGEPRQFVEIGENLFRQVDGKHKIAFGKDAAGDIQDLYLDGLIFMTSSRAPGAESKLLTQLLPLLSLVLFLTVWTGWIYRRKEFKTMTSDERMAIKLSLGMSGFNLMFVIFMVCVVTIYQDALFIEIPTAFILTMILPNIAALLTFGVVWVAIKSWREGYWRTGRRIHYTLVAISAVFMTWFYFYWNFLGVQLP